MENWQLMFLAFHLLALLTGILYVHHDAVIRRQSGFWSVFPVVFLSWIWILLWFAVRPARGGYTPPAPSAPKKTAPGQVVPPPQHQVVNQGRLLFGALNELQWQLRLGKLSQEEFNQEKKKVLDEMAKTGIRQPLTEVIRELTVLTESGCVSSEDLKRLEEICEKTGNRIPPVATAPAAKSAAASSISQPLVGASLAQPRPQVQTPAPQPPKPQPSPQPTPAAPQSQPAPQPAPIRPAPLPTQPAQPRPPAPAQTGFHAQPQPQGGANSPDFYKHWSTQLLVREFLRTKDPVMGRALGARGLPGELEPLIRELGATRLIDLYNETKAPELASELRRRRLDRFL